MVEEQESLEGVVLFQHLTEQLQNEVLECSYSVVLVNLVCLDTEKCLTVLVIRNVNIPTTAINYKAYTFIRTDVLSIESKLDSIVDLSKVNATLKSLNVAPGSKVVDGESCGVAAV